MKKDCITSKRLVLFPTPEEHLDRWISDSYIPSEKEHLLRMRKEAEKHPENKGFFLPFTVTLKKSGEQLGYIQFDGLPKNGHTEINCSVTKENVSEKIVSEALKAAAKWAFQANRGLICITTWLSPDLTTSRILENAGFERVFEADGLIRYEKKRPVPSFLSIFSCLFLVIGFILGYFFENASVFVAVSICAGIFPGALIDRLIAKRRTRISRSAYPPAQ